MVTNQSSSRWLSMVRSFTALRSLRVAERMLDSLKPPAENAARKIRRSDQKRFPINTTGLAALPGIGMDQLRT